MQLALQKLIATKMLTKIGFPKKPLINKISANFLLSYVDVNKNTMRIMWKGQSVQSSRTCYMLTHLCECLPFF